MLVEEFLKPLGMSQVELARRIGMPFQRVSMIVKGHRSITPDTALRLAKLFNYDRCSVANGRYYVRARLDGLLSELRAKTGRTP